MNVITIMTKRENLLYGELVKRIQYQDSILNAMRDCLDEREKIWESIQNRQLNEIMDLHEALAKERAQNHNSVRMGIYHDYQYRKDP